MSDTPTPLPVTEPVTDTWNVRLVIVFLGLALIAVAVGGQILAALGHELPESLANIASAAGGALGALLASTRGRRT
jgi:hypothetical protein